MFGLTEYGSITAAYDLKTGARLWTHSLGPFPQGAQWSFSSVVAGNRVVATGHVDDVGAVASFVGK